MSFVSHFSKDSDGLVLRKQPGTPTAKPEHSVELLSGNGKMVLQIQTPDSDDITCLEFTNEQAVSFADAAEQILFSIGARTKQ